MIENCREIIFPVLQKSLIYFLTPTVGLSDLENLKEEMIAHLTHMLISGRLAKTMFTLTRFSTLKEENQLATRSLQNRGRSLLDIGVDKIFCLNDHISYLKSEIKELSEDEIKKYFDTPFG